MTDDIHAANDDLELSHISGISRPVRPNPTPIACKTPPWIPPRIPHTINPRHKRGARSRDDLTAAPANRVLWNKGIFDLQPNTVPSEPLKPRIQLPPFTHSLLRPTTAVPRIAAMAESYDRERQNDSRLDELSAKVSALRGVTVDIYDNARAQDVIDNTSDTFSSMGTTLKGSAQRLGRMAASGNKMAALKLSGIIVGTVLVLWFIWGLFV
ncbi:hypothetical protein VC83_07643 [Pseudogymnoascus destructans]|nr:uncharacterized protein VC83_07643 [Pseudogymnoascus destructans]OAF55562.1 hypothetical protein VC83_07643 [Pseudogymnoascus destructans]